MLQLEDLIANYPPSDTPDVQTIYTAKREFAELEGKLREKPPIPGKTFFNNQYFILRYMIPNNRLLMMWETGTGKTCGYTILAEYYHRLFLANPETAVYKKTIVLVPGPGLRDELQMQIACKCTSGEYITEKVIDANNWTTRKSNLTRAIGKWYNISTYRVFADEIKSLSDEEIKRRYSQTLIIIDEAHNLNVSTERDKGDRNEKEDKEEKEGKKRTYQQIWRFAHLVESSKIILATATPMINETSEIASLFNILLPTDSQLPIDFNYDTVSIDDIEPYFRGKVSYIRSLETGIDIKIIGEKVNFDQDETIVVDESIMGDIQANAYQRFLTYNNVKVGVYGEERQISNFVFPDGSWGGKFGRKAKTEEQKERLESKGLGKYVTSPSIDNYQATQEFLPWLRVLDQPNSTTPNLDRLSCKYAEQIRAVKAKRRQGRPGTVFVYNNLVNGSGAIVQSLCYEANGWEKYTGLIPAFENIEGGMGPLCSDRPENRHPKISKKPRYALITGETPSANVLRILELFSSPENVNGEYLEILIGSEIINEGISLSHVVMIFLTTTWWNRAGNYQAISRAIRATSHDLLTKEEKKRLQEQKDLLVRQGKIQEADKIDVDNYRLKVDLYQQVAVSPFKQDKSTDLLMYKISNQKDFPIRRMEEILKSVAVDCWINYDRNVRPGDVGYECFSPLPEVIDESTYDVYYIEETLVKVIARVVSLFNNRFNLSRQEIYSLLPEFRPVEIDRGIAQLMTERRIIYDRYGYISYLRQDGDNFFLQRDFPLLATDKVSNALEIYTSSLISSREIPLSDYLVKIEEGSQDRRIDKILNTSPSDPKIDNMIDELNFEIKIRLIESAIIDFINGKTSPIIDRIIEHFSNSIYIITEPLQDLDRLKIKLTTNGKRGRPRKETNLPKTVKIDPDKLLSDTTNYTFEEAAEMLDQGQNLIFMHSLYSNIPSRVSYGESSKKASGRIRLLNVEEGVGWRDTKTDETPVYSAILKVIKKSQESVLEEFGIYGVIGKNGKFKIIDKTTEKKKIQKGGSEADKRYFKGGRVCTTYDKGELIVILWKLGIEYPGLEKQSSVSDRNSMIETISKLVKKIYDYDQVSEWDDDQLRYFMNWHNYLDKKGLCSIIQEWLQEKGRVAI